MKVKEGFVLRSVCGESFLIAEGLENIDFSKLVALNKTSVFIWNLIADRHEFTIDEIVDKMYEEYEVEKDQLRADIQDFFKQMIDAGIVE